MAKMFNAFLGQFLMPFFVCKFDSLGRGKGNG